MFAEFKDQMKNESGFTVVLIFILLRFLWYLLWESRYVEKFDAIDPINVTQMPCAGCAGIKKSHEMCNLMAGENCRIPTWQLSDCWLNAYRECAGKCDGNVANCPCYDHATEKCRSNNNPAEACYRSTYQKCMAGRVIGFPDPDRSW